MIIKYIKSADDIGIFPDQFKSENEKQGDVWVKQTMDFFANRAYTTYIKNVNSFVKNYQLMKGKLRSEDFYEEPEVKSFVDTLTETVELPSFVKLYSIMTTPINELIGEMTKRPDTYKIKAFDSDSQAEELQFKTKVLQEFVISQAKIRILQDAAIEGIELSEEELQQATIDNVRSELDNYTSVAEKWGNKVLTAQKVEFNTKEKAEEAFRDLCISAREYFLLYEDNSKLGFNIEVVNPKNAWWLSTPDKKFISDVTGRAQGAYAAGTVKVMELSEIIEAFPDLTKKEIDHLRKSVEEYGVTGRESNLGKDVTPGVESITYDTYDPLVVQTRMIIESAMEEDHEGIEEFIGAGPNISAFGYKFVVVRAYWISKKKIGKLVWIDEVGNEQVEFVDETYKSGTIPTEISLEWGWINQWYQGDRIGNEIYHVKPFKLLSYCPLIGMMYEPKNANAKSLVDLMKPFQVIYNVCMNQLFDLLRKEIGNVASINIRRIPKLKDGDEQDALDMWELEAREKGIVFEDDSPENTKSPISNTSVAKSLDLTRTHEMQSRYNLAIQMKNECWELIGMSKQRMGSISATETATGTNTAIQQSYAQTESLIVAHEYLMGQLYQAIIDASQYIESNKPYSTISYISTEGESAFIQVNGSDLKFRDLKVFPTNRPEDVRMFEELRQLSQAVIQNGGSIYDVVELYSSQSMRELKKKFKDLHERQVNMQEEAQQIEQQRIEQEKEAGDAEIEMKMIMEREKMTNDNYQKELDRINKKEIAIIQAIGFGRTEAEDTNRNKIPDALEMGRLATEQQIANRNYEMKMSDLSAKNAQAMRKLDLEKEKLDIERERLKVDLKNQQNDLAIAKEHAKNRAKRK